MYELRKYQQEAVDSAIECFNGTKNGILVLPTGSGKSIIIASITEALGGKTLIFQPTKEILEQNLEKLKAIGCNNVGVYSASAGKKYVGKITLATIGSVHKKPELFKDFDRIIIDECHKMDAKSKNIGNGEKSQKMYAKFITDLGVRVLGLTATPYRFRSKQHFKTGAPIAESWFITRTRPNIFKEIVHITQIKELFEAGYLCPLEYDCDNEYNSAFITKTSTGMGFNPDALLWYNQSLSMVQKVVDAVLKTDRKSYLIFTRLTQESKEVMRLLANEGIVCHEVSAQTKPADRDRIIRDFKSGRIKHVVNVGTLTTGFDYPELDCIILASPGQSVALYSQKIGRGIRIAPGKVSCLVVDLCDNVKRFGKIETFEIYDANLGKSGKLKKWRLKSNVGPLTGVDMVSGKDLEIAKDEPPPPKLDSSGGVIIEFGKYSGRSVSTVPLDYLKYCSENIPNPRIKAICKREIDRREIELI